LTQPALNFQHITL